MVILRLIGNILINWLIEEKEAKDVFEAWFGKEFNLTYGGFSRG
jgi:hypothetical protein